ncbi:hypothetical protein ACF0H5_022109 [Mactra antiquata]
MQIAVLALGFLGYTVLANGQSELDVVRERLQRLESRFFDDIALLRREFYQASRKFVKKQDLDQKINNETRAETTKMSNTDYQEIQSKIENLRQNVLNQFELFWDGIEEEKRIRRSLQHDVESLRRSDRHDMDTIANGVENITDLVENFQGNLLENLQIIANMIADRIKEVSENVEKMSENVENICKHDGIKASENVKPHVADCAEWLRLGYTSSGIYTIHPESIWRPINVFCDMETDGGGWIVFQRRTDGSENFYRNWIDYSFGFGNMSKEFWLGNEFIHRLSSTEPCELRIELKDFNNESKFAKYALFNVGPRSGGFVLSIQFFSGDVTDGLIRSHNNYQFSTFDYGPSAKCSKSYKGGWWYADCHSVNLNGLYHNGKHDSYADGINWYDWHGYYNSLMFTEMKFRRR